MLFVSVVLKFASFPRAVAISPRVSSVEPAPFTSAATSARTNSVVAICVVLVAAAAVGAVGTPVSAGEASGALRLRAVCVAVDTGLLASVVLSTLPRPTSPFTNPRGVVIVLFLCYF